MPACLASWPANWLVSVTLRPIWRSVFSGVGSVTAPAEPLGSPDAPPAEPLGSSEAAVDALGDAAWLALGDGDAAPVHADAKMAPAPTRARTRVFFSMVSCSSS